MIQNALRFIIRAGIYAVPLVVFIVSSSMFFPYITGKNFTFRIIVEIIASAWILLALYDATYRPKKSLILWIFSALLVTMAISDSLSPSPLRSFMGNYERMEGYVTLAHTFLYFIVVASTFKKAETWDRFFKWNLGVALAISVHGLLQAFGFTSVSQGATWRVDSTLGNSTYMAVYMLFSMAIAVFVAIRSNTKTWRYTGIAALPLFTFLLFNTGTRGTVLGLGFGVVTGLVYLVLYAKHRTRVRKIAGWILVSIAAILGIFVASAQTEFVQSRPALERLTHIKLSEGGIRFLVWGTAWEGIKERPVFGWGHESFNYVFNKHYDPQLYGAEEWYDRVHNSVFDWLVWGGFVGATIYFGLIGSIFYYIAIYPHRKKYAHVDHLPLEERALLLALFVAYVIHNIFVFDNLMSYIYFAIMIAYIHGRYAKGAIGKDIKISEEVTTSVALPIMGLVCVAAVYAVNVPAIRMSQSLIKTLQNNTVEARSSGFDEIFATETLGSQEVREQYFLFVGEASTLQGMQPVMRDELLRKAEEQIAKQEEMKPDDARTYVLSGAMYRRAGLNDKAIESYEHALELSPNKTSIRQELGLTYMAAGDVEGGLDMLKSAYESDPSKVRSRMIYALGALYARDMTLYGELINTVELVKEAAHATFLFEPLYALRQLKTLELYYSILIEEEPSNFDYRKQLAVLYLEDNSPKLARDVLTKAAQDIPSKVDEINQLISELEGK